MQNASELVTAPIPRAVGVLVADDEPDILDLLDSALQQEGFVVWLAADGMQAVTLYRDHCHSIDAVLLDVCMPLLDGPGTLSALQEITPQVRCCFMSGGLGVHTSEELRSQGAPALLKKPFTLAAVIQAIRSLVDAGELAAPLGARRRNLERSQPLQLDERNTDSP